MSKLLFIDDDPEILQFNRRYFENCGFDICCAQTASRALQFIEEMTFDCIILDIDLPDMDGFSVCRKICRQDGPPVIFLSGLTQDEIRIRSFLEGGVDYLGKPYQIRELELRVKARIGCRNSDEKALVFGSLKIDLNAREITYNGNQLDFSALQFDIISFLARNPGHVFSYEQIYHEVWNEPIMGGRHNLQVQIALMRQKLAAACGRKNYIRTVPRKGYCFIENPIESENL
ncbi:MULTISPECIES: response regulator transcription factor [Anaerotruncus]|uniref:Stage 0 sporulation protein A homolog n=1 Tax=Anaerotruncus colihominis TaxID=169435 RepID=A0A845SR80_9FIRM|nr:MULTISPECIES: response regulator transcription factor [Anaerotruncus]MCI8493835.1 response regulator transcription factor [Anaerotruncus sp.]MCR2024753.1 response regulator transcription factor [Anaerotruncus colihominis]NBI78409.1 DNA-binding response regulator [Anaerotruncus colihominis]NDO38185.1 response regulator transcription factor [Anaerotruncus colihominis]